jgi:hypothetical protein
MVDDLVDLSAEIFYDIHIDDLGTVEPYGIDQFLLV